MSPWIKPEPGHAELMRLGYTHAVQGMVAIGFYSSVSSDGSAKIMGRHRLGRGSPQRATRHPGDGLPPFSYEPSISTPTLLLGLDSVGVAESIAGYTGVIACREIMSRRLLAPRAAKGLWASNIGLVLLCLATAGCQGFSSGGGAGNGQLAVNPTSESLGSVQVGNSATVSGTLNA